MAEYEPYPTEVWDPVLKRNVSLIAAQGNQTPMDYVTANLANYKDYGGPVHFTNGNQPQTVQNIVSGIPNTTSKLPSPKRNLPPAPIPKRPEQLNLGGVVPDDQAPQAGNRLPIPWYGPEHFFDPTTGITYRMGHGNRVRITGHLADFDPVDQWALVFIANSKKAPRDAGVSLGTKANFRAGRAPSEQLTEERPTPQQIGEAINTGAKEGSFRPYAYSGLASTMPKVGPMIAGTIGNALFPGLGTVTAAFDSMVNQYLTRGDVNWKEVGGHAVGGAAGAVGGYAGQWLGGLGGSAAGQALGGAAGQALGSSAARQAYYSGDVDWGRVAQDVAVGTALSAPWAANIPAGTPTTPNPFTNPPPVGKNFGPNIGRSAINTGANIILSDIDRRNRNKNPYGY